MKKPTFKRILAYLFDSINPMPVLPEIISNKNKYLKNSIIYTFIYVYDF